VELLERDFKITGDCMCAQFQPRDDRDKPNHADCRNKVPFQLVQCNLQEHGCTYSDRRMGQELTRFLGTWSSTSLWHGGKAVKARCGLRALTDEEKEVRAAPQQADGVAGARRTAPRSRDDLETDYFARLDETVAGLNLGQL
jgi:hypothetical protein